MSWRNPSISQSDTRPHIFHSSAHEVSGRKWTACSHWFRHSQDGEICAVGLLLLSVLNLLSGSPGRMAITHIRQLVVSPPASNSHAPPTLKEMFFGRAHGEARCGEKHVGASSLDIWSSRKDWRPKLCAFCCGGGGIFVWLVGCLGWFVCCCFCKSVSGLPSTGAEKKRGSPARTLSVKESKPQQLIWMWGEWNRAKKDSAPKLDQQQPLPSTQDLPKLGWGLSPSRTASRLPRGRKELTGEGGALPPPRRLRASAWPLL